MGIVQGTSIGTRETSARRRVRGESRSGLASALTDVCIELEAQGFVFLPQHGFALTAEEIALLTPQLSDGRSKNISLDAVSGKVRGTALRPAARAGLARLMGRYADWAMDLLVQTTPRYAPSLERGRTSFRPRSVDEPAASPRKDDRRLHVDAFPSQPTGGRRILRVFSNVNPAGEPRVWQVGEPFEEHARRWPADGRPPWPGHAQVLRGLGVTKALRTPYDAAMLRLHDAAKLDRDYQRNAPRRAIAFPAGSSWIAFTDSLVHSASAGQHALEQTFYLPVEAMAAPSASPLRILERLSGRSLC